ncbi:MAG: GGDEF domain-containing protein [Patescibacteria group bacterium]|jgi:diguanylate cyclase (GGDEF)-like protein
MSRQNNGLTKETFRRENIFHWLNKLWQRLLFWRKREVKEVLFRQPVRSVVGAREKLLQLTVEQQTRVLVLYDQYMEKVVSRLGIKNRFSVLPQSVLWRDVAKIFESENFDRAFNEITLRLASQVDDKTGLLKHDAFIESYEKMRRELQKTGQVDRYVVFVFFDIDFFKKINAVIGHDLADKVLKQVGEKMRQLRVGDCACRFGGDEFAFFMRDVGRAEISKAVRRIHDAVSRVKIPDVVRNLAAEKGLKEVTFSFGAVAFSQNQIWPSSKAKEVSDALGYLMKNSGRNGYAITLYQGERRQIMVVQRQGEKYRLKYKGSQDPPRQAADFLQDVKNALQRILEDISVADDDLGEVATTKAEEIGVIYYRAAGKA